MPNFICTTCGIEYPASAEPPTSCLICCEERQYVNPNGQSWTTLEEMREGGQYQNQVLNEEPGLHSLTTKPGFAIGQTAYLVQGRRFNVLWDCITYLDDETVGAIQGLGGCQAIALSHPHYYSTQVTWAERLGVPIYIHEDDREWVVRPSDYIQFWSGEALTLSDGLTLHRLGGHYKGGAVLLWEDGMDGEGVLLSGDIIQVVADARWVSFMYSYPNLIPLPAHKVGDIAKRVSGLPFNRLYNAFHRVVKDDAKDAVVRSAQRYIDAIEGRWFDT